MATIRESKIAIGALTFIGALIILLAYVSAEETLGLAMPMVVWAGAGALATVAAAWTIATVWIKTQQVRALTAQYDRDRELAKADIIKAQAEAAKAQVMVLTAPKDHQLVVREETSNEHVQFTQLHLNPSRYVNGHPVAPTEQEMQVYQSYHRGNVPSAGEAMVIDQPPSTDILSQYSDDWLESIVLPAPHVHYCGATRSGKTMLSNHHLTNILKTNPATEIRLINPKHTAARKPFIINPDYTDIDQVLEGLQMFNAIMIKRKNDPALSKDSHKIIFVIDEWDWIYETFGQAATRLLIPLVKVGAELNLQVVLIGQSPLSGDTGLSQSFYHNMVRVAIWQEGARLLNNYPLDKKYKTPLMAKYESLKNIASEFGSDNKLRYCVVVPMSGNPSVQVIPHHTDPLTIKQKALPAIMASTEEQERVRHIYTALKKVEALPNPSLNKLHHEVSGTDTNINQRQRQSYLETLEKYRIPHTLGR